MRFLVQILLNKILDKLENNMFYIFSRYFKDDSHSRQKCKVTELRDYMIYALYSTHKEWEEMYLYWLFTDIIIFNSIKVTDFHIS